MGLFRKIKEAVLASTAAKIAAAVVVVAVIGGGTVGLVYADVFTSAESAVEEAAQTMKDAAVSSYEELFGWNALRDNITAEGAELGLEFVIKEIPMDSFGMEGTKLPNFGVQLKSRTTAEHQTRLELGLKVAETTVLSASAYTGKDSLQVTVPKLFDAVLTMNYGSENFKEEFLTSYFVEFLGLPKEELEQNWKLLPKDDIVETLMKEHGETIIKLAGVYKELADGTVYEKAGKQELVVDNGPMNCKVYTALVTEEALKKAMDEVLPMVEDFMKDFYAGLSAEEAEMFGTYEEFKTTYVEYYRELKDVHSTIYVYNKRIAKQEVSFAVGEDKGEVVLLYALEGNPYENMELSALFPVPEKEPVAFGYTIATKLTEDDFSVDMEINAEEEEAVLSFDYERLGGEFTAVFKSDDESLELTGAIGELELGKRIGLELYDYVYQETEYQEEQELNAKLYLTVLEGEVLPLDGEQQDVLQMTKEDFDALGEEISGNLMWMLFSMMGLFQ